jgi:hypothetical protein
VRITWWVVCAVHPWLEPSLCYSTLAAFCMLLVIPVMPVHPMSLPITLGAGISGAVILKGIIR